MKKIKIILLSALCLANSLFFVELLSMQKYLALLKTINRNRTLTLPIKQHFRFEDMTKERKIELMKGLVYDLLEIGFVPCVSKYPDFFTIRVDPIDNKITIIQVNGKGKGLNMSLDDLKNEKRRALLGLDKRKNIENLFKIQSQSSPEDTKKTINNFLARYDALKQNK
jgi:hypothetical protein